MMIASTNPATQRRRPVDHRTEPRIVLQMQGTPDGNTKLKPTVFLPSAIRVPKGFLAK